MGTLRTWWRRLGVGRPAAHAIRRDADMLIDTLSARDPVTGEHVNRVACIATEIALMRGMPQDAIRAVEVGARLHDVGKLGIPDSILKKPDRLTDVEWEVMRRHPRIGATLLQALPSLAHLAETVAGHHERWDGEGYPARLSGEAIPLEARIFAIADSIDAMTSDRPYQARRDWPYVAGELEREGGRQWDPDLAALTLGSLHRIQALEAGCPHGH